MRRGLRPRAVQVHVAERSAVRVETYTAAARLLQEKCANGGEIARDLDGFSGARRFKQHPGESQKFVVRIGRRPRLNRPALRAFRSARRARKKRSEAAVAERFLEMLAQRDLQGIGGRMRVTELHNAQFAIRAAFGVRGCG